MITSGLVVCVLINLPDCTSKSREISSLKGIILLQY